MCVREREREGEREGERDPFAVRSLADLYQFDTSTFQWSAVQFPSPPQGRMSHGFTALDRMLYAFGGVSCPTSCSGKAPARIALSSVSATASGRAIRSVQMPVISHQLNKICLR